MPTSCWRAAAAVAACWLRCVACLASSRLSITPDASLVAADMAAPVTVGRPALGSCGAAAAAATAGGPSGLCKSSSVPSAAPLMRTLSSNAMTRPVMRPSCRSCSAHCQDLCECECHGNQFAGSVTSFQQGTVSLAATSPTTQTPSPWCWPGLFHPHLTICCSY